MPEFFSLLGRAKVR